VIGVKINKNISKLAEANDIIFMIEASRGS